MKLWSAASPLLSYGFVPEMQYTYKFAMSPTQGRKIQSI